MNQTEPERPLSTWKRYRFVIATIGVVLVLVVAGWWVSSAYIKGELEKKLVNLGYGKPTVGSISISSSGVTATDISFLREGDSGEPWLAVSRLEVLHSPFGLLKGAEVFDAIKIKGAKVVLDLDKPPALETQGTAESSFQLPTGRLDVQNLDIKIRGPKKDLSIAAIDLSVSRNPDEQSFSIDGSVGDLLGGKWMVLGKIDAKAQQISLDLNTAGLELKTEAWKNIPGLPAGIENRIRADGLLDLELTLAGDMTKPSLSGLVKPASVDVQLPGFDLGFVVSEGVIEVSDSDVVFQKLGASTPDGGRIQVSGETGIDAFPIQTRFRGSYDHVSVATLNKLAFYIPEVVRGRTAAGFEGAVSVEESTRTTLALTAKGEAKEAWYDQVEGQRIEVDVNIDDLIVDRKQQVESIHGAVVVTGESPTQEISRVFQAFDLENLSSFLELRGEGSAVFDLKIPFESAESLSTWNLNVESKMETGMFASRPVENVSVTANLQKGHLIFKPVVATIGSSKSSDTMPISSEQKLAENNLVVEIDWPLETTAGKIDHGIVEVTTMGVTADWLKSVVGTIANNSAETDFITQEFLQSREWNGRIASETRIEFRTDNPEQFQLETKLSQSTIGSGKTDLNIEGGRFSLDGNSNFGLEFTSNIDGSESIRVSSSGNLSQLEKIGVVVDAKSVRPLSVCQLMEDAQQLLDGSFADIAPYIQRVRQLDPRGRFNATLKLDSLVSSGQLELKAETPSIVLKEVGELNNVEIDMVFDQDEVLLNRFRLVQDGGKIDADGKWFLDRQTGNGKIQWEKLKTRTVLKLTGSEVLKDFFSTKHFLAVDPNSKEAGLSNSLIEVGETDGVLSFQPANQEAEGVDSPYPVVVDGNIKVSEIGLGRLKPRPVEFRVETNQREVLISTTKTESSFPIDATAKIALNDSLDVIASANINQLRLSQFFRQQLVSDRPNSKLDVTGVAEGKFEVAGSLKNQDWKSSGKLKILSPTVNRKNFSDIFLDWDQIGTPVGTFEMTAFGGKVELVDLRTQPEAIEVKISDIELKNIVSVFDSSNGLTGRLSGTATLNDWSLADTRWAEVKLEGTSIRAFGSEFGDFTATANFRNEILEYELGGTFLGGKLIGSGFAPVDVNRIEESKFPLQLSFNNATLSVLNRKSNVFRGLGGLQGKVTATADVVLAVNQRPAGSGRISVQDLKWNSDLISKDASIRFQFDEDKAVLDDVRIDLKRGEVAAKVNLPFRGAGPGSYRIDIRHLDATRLAAIALGEDAEAAGLLDIRLEGQIGNQITGNGYVGFDRASLHHVPGQSARLPIRYRWSPKSQSGLIEFRRSRFRLFDGRVAGDATLKFGQRLDLDVDLVLTNVKSGEVIATVFDINDVDQGVFSGRLQLMGRGLKDARDLEGRLTGSLDRANVLKLPVLNEIARFLSTGNLINQSYESDSIDIRLNRGRAEVRQLNFRNSLATIVINGYAYLDGRLDLDVAARVERLNQPTLVDEYLNSPLSQIRLATPQLVTRVAEFLSERVVFLHVGGDFSRPQLRLDSAKQLREETIRYFLRDRNLFPFDSNPGK